jgi:hypothetical protein
VLARTSRLVTERGGVFASIRAEPFWSTSGSAQVKTVTVPDLDVLHAYEALSQADDLAELCGRRVWRPGSTATPMIGILVRSQW